jgi:1,2-diacylglycerol 3-alpha-glucosyltransferase
MKIALFSDTYLPSKNGVATSLAQLKRELTLLGHTVYIYTAKEPDAKAEDNVFRSSSIDIHLKIDSRVAFANIPRITAKIKKDNIDIIHTHTEFTMGLTGRYIARHLGIPHIHTVHTMWDEYRHYFAKNIISNRILSTARVDSMFRSFVSRCTALVCPSSKAQAYLKKLGISRSYIINNGVDAEVFKKSISPEEKLSLRQKLGLNADDIIVLFVGRIAKEKRAVELYGVIKQAVAVNPSIKGLFIGQGPDLAALQQQAAKDGMESTVILTGYLPYDEIFKYYAIADIYATVSLSEVQPMTVIEALIAGLPVIARSDLAYVDMVIPEKNGFLTGTDEETVAKIVMLAADKEPREAFSAKSREHSLNFSAHRQAMEMAELYKKAIDWGRPDRQYKYLFSDK